MLGNKFKKRCLPRRELLSTGNQSEEKDERSWQALRFRPANKSEPGRCLVRQRGAQIVKELCARIVMMCVGGQLCKHWTRTDTCSVGSHSSRNGFLKIHAKRVTKDHLDLLYSSSVLCRLPGLTMSAARQPLSPRHSEGRSTPVPGRQSQRANPATQPGGI